MAYESVQFWIREFMEYLKTQEMCNKVVEEGACSLVFVPNRFKMEEMCNEVGSREPYTVPYVPDHLITRQVCEEVMRVRPAAFFLFP